MSDCCALGMDAELYVGAAGNPTAITGLTKYDAVSDVTLNATADEADVTSRGNSGWRAFCSTLREMSVDFTIKWCPSDPQFVMLRNAYLGNTVIGVGVKTGDGTGHETILFDASVTNMSISQPLAEGQEVSVTLKLRKFISWTA